MTVTADQIARTLDRRDAERKARAAARAQQRLALLPEALRVLRQGYRVDRVSLFGSLASGEVSEGSDVDLAVEGLDPSAYFAALTDLMTLFQASVDLVRLEEAAPTLKARILAEGRSL
jgi:hypothetical protein